MCREPPVAQPCVPQHGVTGQAVAQSLSADYVCPWVPDLCSFAHAKAVGGLLFSPGANQFSGPLQTLTCCPVTQLNSDAMCLELGFPDGTRGEELSSQCRRQMQVLIGKISWRRARQPTPVYLPGKPHGQRSLEGLQPRRSQSVRHD